MDGVRRDMVRQVWSDIVAKADLFAIAQSLGDFRLGDSEKEKAQLTSFGMQLNQHKGWVFSESLPEEMRINKISRNEWMLTAVNKKESVE